MIEQTIATLRKEVADMKAENYNLKKELELKSMVGKLERIVADQRQTIIGYQQDRDKWQGSVAREEQLMKEKNQVQHRLNQEQAFLAHLQDEVIIHRNRR